VATTPDYLTLKDHRDASNIVERAFRWAVMGLIAAIAVAALFNLFGQRPTTSSAAGAAADLIVRAPAHVRGGLLYQAHITVAAHQQVADAVLVFDPGWTEQMTINTIEPGADDENGSNGRLALGYGKLEAGDRLSVFLQFQVNPVNVGRRSQRVELRDGPKLVAAADRTVTVFP
jgi:hypothetical protein